jgi:hypothetical protein
MKQMNHMFQVCREKKIKIHSNDTYKSYVTSLFVKKVLKLILMKHMNSML